MGIGARIFWNRVSERTPRQPVTPPDVVPKAKYLRASYLSLAFACLCVQSVCAYPGQQLPVVGCDSNWHWLSPTPIGGSFDKLVRSSKWLSALRRGWCIRSSDNGATWESL